MKQMKTFRVIRPLYNFSVSTTILANSHMSPSERESLLEARKKDRVEGIDVSDGVKIKLISKQDYDALKNAWLLPEGTRLESTTFVLEKDIDVEENGDIQIANLMTDIVLALRLLKKGYLSGSTILHIPTTSRDPNLSRMSQVLLTEVFRQRQRKFVPSGNVPYAIDPYTFRFEELSELKGLVQKVQNLDLHKRKDLKLARERFERAYEEEDFEDQLIDIMIAFESLFLKGEKGNVAHGKIIAVGCSCLLGKNEEQRLEIESFLDEAYRIRNCIVHGSEYGKPTVGKEYGMPEFVSRIEDYLRESLKKLLA